MRDITWATIGLTFAGLLAAALYTVMPPLVPPAFISIACLTLSGLVCGAVFTRFARVASGLYAVLASVLFLAIRFAGAVTSPAHARLLPLGLMAASSALTIFAFWVPPALSARRGGRLAPSLLAGVAVGAAASAAALALLIGMTAPRVLHLDPLAATQGLPKAGLPEGAEDPAAHANSVAVLTALTRVRAAPCDGPARAALRDALLTWLRGGGTAIVDGRPVSVTRPVDPRALTMAGQALAAGVLRPEDAPGVTPAGADGADVQAMVCK